MGCCFVALLYPERPSRSLGFKSPGPLGVTQVLKRSWKYFDYSTAASELLSGELYINPAIYDYPTVICRCSSPNSSARMVVYYIGIVYTCYSSFSY